MPFAHVESQEKMADNQQLLQNLTTLVTALVPVASTTRNNKESYEETLRNVSQYREEVFLLIILDNLVQIHLHRDKPEVDKNRLSIFTGKNKRINKTSGKFPMKKSTLNRG